MKRAFGYSSACGESGDRLTSVLMFGGFQRIAVIGPGLLGGSIIRAVEKCEPNIELRIWARREEAVRPLMEEKGIALATTDLEAIVDGVDLIVLATPVGVMKGLAERIVKAPGFAACAIVTDVGSVKAPVVAELEPIFARAGARFVGSHPMAGSEKTGMEFARPDLFRGAACLITETDRTDAAAAKRVDAFWTELGCRTARLTPEDHDLAVALISHLPHLVASLLVETALGESPQLGGFAGGGFRDSTRIASGSPGMWAEILMENRAAVAGALRQFHTKVAETLAFFETGSKEEIHRLLAEAKDRRDGLPDFPQRLQ